MSDWAAAVNGNWTDATKWTGGVPNGLGALANFTVSTAGSATRLIEFSQLSTVTVGTLNLTTDSDDAWAFLGETGVTSAELRFHGAGGAPAFLNVDTNNSNSLTRITDSNGLRVMLASDLILTTQNSDTLLSISAPISGFGSLFKFGFGTLRLEGSSSTSGFFLYGGRTEITATASLSGRITLDNDAILAATASCTLSNRIETGGGGIAGAIVAAAGTTLTLTGQLELRSSSQFAVRFGSATDSGTVVLSGASRISGDGGFVVAGGTLRFGNAAAAANYFSELETGASLAALQVRSGATLDTGGFAATIDNLDLDGTLQSSGGALVVTVDEASSTSLGTIVGTAGADRLVFNSAGNFSLGPVAFVGWNSSIDTIILNGDSGFDSITGSAQNDTLNGGGGADSLRGLGGNDVYLLDNAGDTVFEATNEGFDTAYVYTSYTVAAGVHLEVLSAYNWYGFEAYNLTGNELNNRLYGNGGVNQFVGGGGHDMIIGFGGGDNMNGGGGDDAYYTFSANDVIVEAAGGGRDSIFSYTSFALAGDDDIEVLSTYSFGGTETIHLTGNALAQLVYGNAGNNILNGAGGADYLHGFAGADTFAFTTALVGGNVDSIGDFSVADDTIALDDAIFTGLGNLADAFVTGSAAVDANDRIVYNSATGALLYDADGNGAGAAVQFASLSAGLALTAGDFAVI